MNSPKVSVIIAARDEEALLPHCLASLLSQKVEFPFEILVVDNGSRDGTLAAAENFADPRIRVFSEPRPGTPKARNLGAEKAIGEILVFTDADCTFPENWLTEITAPLRNPSPNFPVGVVGGKVTSAFRRADWPTLVEDFADRLFYVWEERDRTERFPGFLPWAPTCNLAIRKDLFEDLGRFEENWTIGYDPDLCWRAALSGFTVIYAETAEVFHLRRGSLSALLKQTHRYAYFNSILFKTYRELWSFRRRDLWREKIAGLPERLRFAITQPRKFWPIILLVSSARFLGILRAKIFPADRMSELTDSRLGKAKIRRSLPPAFAALHAKGFCHWPHEEDLILFQPNGKKRIGLNPPARQVWEAKLLGNALPEINESDALELEMALAQEGLLQ